MQKILARAALLVAAVGAIAPTVGAQPVVVQQKEKGGFEKRFGKVVGERMVEITFPVPENLRWPNDPPTVEMAGWAIDTDLVLMPLLPAEMSLMADGKPVEVVKYDFENRMAIVRVQLDKPLQPIKMAESSGDDVIAVSRFRQRTLVSSVKLSALHQGFLKLVSADQILPGAGLFSRDGEFITIVSRFEDKGKGVLAVRPEAVRAFIKSVQ